MKILHHIFPDSTLLKSWTLAGGVSARTTAHEIQLADGSVIKVVVREHGKRDLQRNPNIAQDEYRLLKTLYDAGLAVPEPYHAEPLVIAFVDGVTERNPLDMNEYVRQMATHLAQVHSVDIAELGFLPDISAHMQHSIASTKRSFVGASEAHPTGRPDNEPQNKPTLLHGDYWPGNILSKDGQIQSIVDWEDAAIGDPLADVGNARLEILWAFGEGAMRDFTEAYQAAMPHLHYDHLAYWDLFAALKHINQMDRWDDWGIDKATQAVWKRKLQWFIQV